MRKRAAAAAAWHEALGAVEIEAAEPVRKMLYTSLYHALMAPSVFMDVDGSYRGPDHEIHHARGLYIPIHVLAVGYLSRAASVVDSGAA